MTSGVGRLGGAAFDALVVGAGINGASAAQHLAAAGYRVLLVDKGDIGAGTTSRSSRLLHCGARYFVPGRSMSEFFLQPRKGVDRAEDGACRHADARADEARTRPSGCAASTGRIRSTGAGGTRRGSSTWRSASSPRWGPSDVPLGYRRMSREETLASPLLEWQHDPDRLTGAAVMQEFQYTWPERIAVDAALDARRMGAEVLTYTAWPGCGRRRMAALDCRCCPAKVRTVRVSARMMVNTAGIWIDEVNALGAADVKRKGPRHQGHPHRDPPARAVQRMGLRQLLHR